MISVEAARNAYQKSARKLARMTMKELGLDALGVSAALIIVYAYIKEKIDTSAAIASGILGILVLIFNIEFYSSIGVIIHFDKF